jgi:hypothetical protein
MPSYSGLYNGVHGEDHELLSQSVAKGNAQVALSRVFANRLYGRASTRALLKALIGAAAGGSASSTHQRVQANADQENNVQGGLRTIETFTAVNRVTTATDETMFENALDQSSKPTYVDDEAGVGGGGKLGY